MGTKNPRTRYTGSLIFACIGCFLIGFSLVYPIYYASRDSSYYVYGGRQYIEVKPFSGTVSENDTVFYVALDAEFYYDVTLEVRNFYTNNTPVTLILESFYYYEVIPNFYNLTDEPINYQFQVWEPNQFLLIIQYNGSASAFSFWALLHGNFPLPPLPPPPPLFPLTITWFVIGLFFLIIGLYGFRVEKRIRRSHNLDRALILCSLGVLLISLSFPSLVRPYYYLYYHPVEYIDFGEFSGTVTQAVPRVNMTLSGLNESVVELRTFFVINSSVTVRAYTLDGSQNYTWSYVNSQYPGSQDFVFDTRGETVIEIERETGDTGFSCWVLANFREVEVCQNFAGNYTPYAAVFLVSGVILLTYGLYYVFNGFKDLSKP